MKHWERPAQAAFSGLPHEGQLAPQALILGIAVFSTYHQLTLRLSPKLWVSLIQSFERLKRKTGFPRGEILPQDLSNCLRLWPPGLACRRDSPAAAIGALVCMCRAHRSPLGAASGANVAPRFPAGIPHHAPSVMGPRVWLAE